MFALNSTEQLRRLKAALRDDLREWRWSEQRGERVKAELAQRLLWKLDFLRVRESSDDDVLRAFSAHCDRLAKEAQHRPHVLGRRTLSDDAILYPYVGLIHNRLEEQRIMNIPAEQRVRAGAELFDARIPGWYKGAKVKGLDFLSIGAGILRQLTGLSFDEAVARLKPEASYMGYQSNWYLEHGLEVAPYRTPAEKMRKAAQKHIDLWRGEIVARRSS